MGWFSNITNAQGGVEPLYSPTLKLLDVSHLLFGNQV